MIYGADTRGPTHYLLQSCYCSCEEIPASVFLDDYGRTRCPAYNLLVWHVVNCKSTMTLRIRISNEEVSVLIVQHPLILMGMQQFKQNIKL